MQTRSTFSLLPQRSVETGTRVGEPTPLPDRTRPDAFLLAVSDVTRRAKGRAHVHAEHGHRLRARDARKAGARMRRLLVRQAIAGHAPAAAAPAAPSPRPRAAEPATFALADADGSLLERISAYSAVAAPSMLRRR